MLKVKYSYNFLTKAKKSNLRYTHLISFRVSRVSGALLRDFARRNDTKTFLEPKNLLYL